MQATPQQAAEGAVLVKVLAAVLERLVSSNASLALTDAGAITKFHALKPPGIAIEAYLERIHKYACCSNECFILALIYIDRLIQRNNFLLTELNVHRVVITAILLAAKFFDDAYYNNAYYAKVGGVLVSEMNGLEVDYLFRINFSLHVQCEEFEKYKAELVAHSIHSGLTTLTTVTVPLPQIAEVEPTMHSQSSSAMTSPELMQQQQQFLQTSGMSIPMMAPPAHVTPSPNAEEMIRRHSQHQQSVGPLQPPPAGPILNPLTNFPHTLYVPAAAHTNEQLQQQLVNDATIQQQQHALLHRANSLPPLFSSGPRCIDHARNPPYHSAPAPMAPLVPILNVDQEQYQLVMNQLFPIQTTLMHHNHGVAASSGHHHNASSSHQGYIQGGMGGTMVAHY